MESIFQGSRSAIIEMTLVVNDREHKVSHSDRDFFLLEEPAQIEPGPGTFVLSIDGKRQDFAVEITEASVGRKISAVRTSDTAVAQAV